MPGWEPASVVVGEERKAGLQAAHSPGYREGDRLRSHPEDSQASGLQGLMDTLDGQAFLDLTLFLLIVPFAMVVAISAVLLIKVLRWGWGTQTARSSRVPSSDHHSASGHPYGAQAPKAEPQHQGLWHHLNPP